MDLLAKAFGKANAEASKQFADPDSVRSKPVKDADQLLREATAPMTAADAIQRILLAWKDKDYFRLLGMPPVQVDALGKPSWDCTNADVSKAYRRLSVLVHPDKNEGEDARLAFEHMNEAHRILKDPGKLADEKQRQFSAALERQAKREASATVHERVLLNATRSRQAKELRKAEEISLHTKIHAQARSRQELSKRKRDAAQRAKRRAGGSDEDEGDAAEDNDGAPMQQRVASSDDDDDAGVSRRLATMQRRRSARKSTF